MKYQLAHLGVGGILDQAIAIVKDNFGLLFGILLYAWIPYSLISTGIQVANQPEIPPNPTTEDVVRINQAQMQNLPVTLGLAAIGFLIVLPITNAAVIYAVAERYLGRAVTAVDAIKAGAARLGPLIGTSILLGLAIMGGMILCIVPGILFALWFGLAQHVVVLEGLSGSAAMTRSKQLVRPHLGTFLAMGIILFVIALVVGAGSTLIPNVWLQSAVSVVVQAVLTLFSTAAAVVFYFSCRCAVENFDLELLASAVGGEAVAVRDPEETAGGGW